MNKKKKEDDILRKGFHIKGKIIAEQCYDGKKVFFAVWDGINVSYEDEIDEFPDKLVSSIRIKDKKLAPIAAKTVFF